MTCLADSVFRELAEVVNLASVVKHKFRRGDILHTRLVRLKELLFLRLHDCSKYDRDEHLRQALNALNETLGSRIQKARLNVNRKFKSKIQEALTHLVTDGSNLGLALGLATMGAQQRALDSLAKAGASTSSANLGSPGEAVNPAEVASSPKGKTPDLQTVQAVEADRIREECIRGDDCLHGRNRQQNFAEAFAHYKVAAEGRHPLAAQRVGWMLQEGLGVEASPEEAFQWYSLSAQLKCGEGHNSLGLAFLTGTCSADVDHTSALEHFQEGARLNNLDSIRNLGRMHEEGLGVEANSFEAAKWYLRAAKQGHSGAMLSLSKLLLNGRGANDDDSLDSALTWLSKAAEQGEVEAIYHMAVIFEDGLGVKADASHALELYLKAGRMGYAESMANAARLLLLQEKYQEALSLLHDAAEEGCAEAFMGLGYVYEEGIAVEKNPNYAFSYYAQASQLNHPPALTKLAGYFFAGIGVEKDILRALELYSQAAKMGDSEAQNELGVIYEEGLGVEADIDKAVRWFRMAADQNHADALCNLAELYEQGRGVTLDLEASCELYAQAASIGNELAARRLGYMERDVNIGPDPQH